MEELLQMAKKACDQAEVYSISYDDDLVLFEDARLYDINSKKQSGFSLRIIRDGKLGFAYTRNLINRQELLRNAQDSLEGKVEADYQFPSTPKPTPLKTFDPSLESLSPSDLVEECNRLCQLLIPQTDGEISAAAYTHVEKIRIINSTGTDLSMQSGEYGIYANMIFPGSGVGIGRDFLSKKFERFPQTLIQEMTELFRKSSRVVEPKSGRMKVLFMPNSMMGINWRILSGTNGKNIYLKVSPVASKIGTKIFDEKITIYDDPLNDARPKARSFDDEGVACRPLTLVQDGVLKNFFYDLNYAAKLKVPPTGSGYRTGELFMALSADPITLKPIPALPHLVIKPGKSSLTELVKQIDRGIILEGALGPHSGNIPNGDFSFGVSPGLYVEKGKIVGRVKDAMVSGNIYEPFQQVVDIGDTLYPCAVWGWVPPILCDDVNVATKN